MITKRTVLILGAGASKPYGFPLGSELRDEVIKITSNFFYGPVFETRGVLRTDISRFATELSQSGFSSADAFLEKRPEWMLIGKAAMAFSLLATERESRGRVFPPKQPRDHWYETLWSFIKAPTLREFKAQPLTIVTFNYDRSLEHYLTHILSNNYDIQLALAAKSLPVIHVHGSLGEYNFATYGKKLNDEMLFESSNSIRIVHEADIKHTAFVKARTEIREAQLTLFLGFGYHDANMSKLGFPIGFRRGPLVLGTHKGIKTQFWNQICARNGFSASARTSGAGSISEFISAWLR